MYQRTVMAMLAAALLLFAGQASRAEMVYQFDQVGPTMQNGPTGTEPFPTAILGDMRFAITDSAFASGMDFRQLNGDIANPYAYLEGLTALEVSLVNVAQAISASLDDFLEPIPLRGAGYSHIQVSSAPGGMPVGSILYSSDQFMSVEFIMNGTSTVMGKAIGDGSCFWGCSFTGTLTTAVHVPEPAAILTFGIALMGLAAVIRRRTTREG